VYTFLLLLVNRFLIALVFLLSLKHLAKA
jgi:hypothetical protein